MQRIPWLILVLACFPLACQPGEVSFQRLDPRIAAPDFQLPRLGGGTVSLSQLRGQIVILDFWATWCPPCRMSLPSLETVYRAYRSRGVTILLVNEGESNARISAWAGKRFTAPILLDRNEQIAARYGVEGLPRMFVVDREGQVAFSHAGYGGGLEHQLHLLLDDLLSTGAQSTR